MHKPRLAASLLAFTTTLASVGLLAPAASANNDTGSPTCWSPGSGWGCAERIPGVSGTCYQQVRMPYLSSGRVYSRGRALCDSLPQNLVIRDNLRRSGGTSLWTPQVYCSAKGEMTVYQPNPDYYVCYTNLVSVADSAGTQTYTSFNWAGTDDSETSYSVYAQNYL